MSHAMAPRLKHACLILLIVFVLPVAARAALYAVGDHPRAWREANWSSTGVLPAAAGDPEARVLVFAARTGSWRSIFAVHTWIVVKPADAKTYTRYDVTAFGRPIRINGYPADARWFSSVPQAVADIRGPRAAAAIPKIEAAVKDYPYAEAGSYRMWPGPNSNTFVATIMRAVPELEIAMPPEAIGRDYRADGSFFGYTGSGTGVEVSVYGLLGVKVGWVEGFEINILGLVAGLDVRRPGLKIPGFGRLGVESAAVHTATANAR